MILLEIVLFEIVLLETILLKTVLLKKAAEKLSVRLALASGGIRARLQSCRKCFKLTRALAPEIKNA